LAFRLRPGNAGSNTATDHIEVLGEAIAQVPARYRRNLLITVDGAGATLDLVKHITKLNTAPGRRVHYSVGFDLDHRAAPRSADCLTPAGTRCSITAASPATVMMPAWPS
jgi:hypothetical protein